MPSKHLLELFEDPVMVEKIKKRLPHLFWLAALDAMKAGKLDMNVGRNREKVLVALLIHKFGRENVDSEIAPTKAGVDVRLFDKEDISIKTSTGSGTFKLTWTTTSGAVARWKAAYAPKEDLLLAIIMWGKTGGLYYIPKEAQEKVFAKLGPDGYIFVPSQKGNPRGSSITEKAIEMLLRDGETKSISIFWKQPETKYDPYERWVDYWKEANS